jgi:hypothetical protein
MWYSIIVFDGVLLWPGFFLMYTNNMSTRSRKTWDPNLLLPRTVVSHIFSYLSFLDLVRCLEVSRSWYKKLLREPSLWPRQQLIMSFCYIYSRAHDFQRSSKKRRYKLITPDEAGFAQLDEVRHLWSGKDLENYLSFLAKMELKQLSIHIDLSTDHRAQEALCLGQFQHLKSLWYSVCKFCFCDLLEVIEHLPSLEKLTIQGKNRERSWTFRSIDVGVLKLKQLILLVCPVNTRLFDKWLGNLISCSPRLTNVEIYYNCLPGTGSTCRAIKALTSLRCLTLGITKTFPKLETIHLNSLSLIIDPASFYLPTETDQLPLSKVTRLSLAIDNWQHNHVTGIPSVAIAALTFYGIGKNVTELLLDDCPYHQATNKAIMSLLPCLQKLILSGQSVDFAQLRTALEGTCPQLKFVRLVSLTQARSVYGCLTETVPDKLPPTANDNDIDWFRARGVRMIDATQGRFTIVSDAVDIALSENEHIMSLQWYSK